MTMQEQNRPEDDAPRTSGSYEFTDEQNRLFSDLAKKMRLVGFFMLVLGIAALIALVVRLVAAGGEPIYVALPVGVFLVLTGLWTLRSEIAFRRIVDTEGRDISHIMKAMGELRKFYALQYWLVVICLLLFLVSLFAEPVGVV